MYILIVFDELHNPSQIGSLDEWQGVFDVGNLVQKYHFLVEWGLIWLYLATKLVMLIIGEMRPKSKNSRNLIFASNLPNNQSFMPLVDLQQFLKYFFVFGHFSTPETGYEPYGP